MRDILILTFFLSLFGLTYEIDYKNEFPFETFNKKHYSEILRFGISDREAILTFRIKFKYSTYDGMEDADDPKTIMTSINLYTDEEWEEVLKTKDCFEKSELAQRRISVGILESGKWSNWRDLTIYPLSTRPHFFYLMLVDCDMAVPQHPDYANQIHVEIIAKNSENSHVSYEEEGIIEIYFVISIFSVVYLIYHTIVGFKNRLPKISRNYSFTIWYLALVCETLSGIFETVTLAFLHKHGWGVFGFDMGNQLFSILSQNLLICMVILISWNWCLPKPKDELDEDDDILTIMLGIFTIFQVFLLLIFNNAYIYFFNLKKKFFLIFCFLFIT